jgi:uroporphyrin-III C-methyltransferase
MVIEDMVVMRAKSTRHGPHHFAMRAAISTQGKVYLIGAGPGAADLLTLRAARVLATAQVVLVDALVDGGVLEQCATDARIMQVGKRGGCRSTPQAFIQRLMLRYARQGRVVARLKGGDAFVFGRGGEEAAYLRQHGIEVEIVPGLTAGLAAPAALGIPVTHRGIAPGVTFVTGHASDGVEPDWRALAQTRTTLVIYMGLQRLAHITCALMAGGLSGATPVAAIAHGTLPRERHVVAPLCAIARAVEQAGLVAPAVIVVGEVVSAASARVVAQTCADHNATQAREATQA